MLRPGGWHVMEKRVAQCLQDNKIIFHWPSRVYTAAAALAHSDLRFSRDNLSLSCRNARSLINHHQGTQHPHTPASTGEQVRNLRNLWFRCLNMIMLLLMSSGSFNCALELQSPTRTCTSNREPIQSTPYCASRYQVYLLKIRFHSWFIHNPSQSLLIMLLWCEWNHCCSVLSNGLGGQ